MRKSVCHATDCLRLIPKPMLKRQLFPQATRSQSSLPQPCLAALSQLCSARSSVYLGSAGILALAAALASFVQAVKSVREEDTFRGIPVASVVLSVLASGAWIALYTVGFMM